MNKIFIDGAVGTTGLEIRERLLGRKDLEVLSISEESRKDTESRKRILNQSDIVILCLPDEAAREAVSFIENEETRVIDASTAHRTQNGWVYGFTECSEHQSELINTAKRVANPGCYAIGSISIIRPLLEAGVLPSDWPLSINAISGYSGGGKSLIQDFEEPKNIGASETNFFAYGLDLKHKHIPEIMRWSGLSVAPIFLPSVGRFRQGMLVQVPIPMWALPKQLKTADIQNLYEEYYSGCHFIQVSPLINSISSERINPEELNGTNSLRINVFGNDNSDQLVVNAILDNLGKGASGQVVQNLNLMIGVPETVGLKS